MAFDPRNILVIDFGQLGDVVMSLPALRAIRERFPYAKITVAVGKPGKELLSLCSYANEILEVDRVALRDGPTLISIGRIAKFVAQVRKQKFDFVIDLHSYYETNILGFLSGAPLPAPRKSLARLSRQLQTATGERENKRASRRSLSRHTQTARY